MSMNVQIQRTRSDRHADAALQNCEEAVKSGPHGIPPIGPKPPIAFKPDFLGDAQIKHKIYIDKFNKLRNPNENEVQDLKELKRQACESISICRSLNSKRISELKQEISNSCFSKALSVFCKFSLFNDHFCSSPDVKKVYVNLEKQRQLEFFDTHLLKMQNEILNKHAQITNQWRPRKNEVTRKSLLARVNDPEVQKTLDQVLSIYLNKKACSNEGNSLVKSMEDQSLPLVTSPKTIINEKLASIKSTIMEKLASIKFSEFDLGEKEIINVDENIELIVTGKNNYYLVFKDQIMGKGAFKTVYTGLDLTKNRAIALGYSKNMLREETTYCEITGKDLKKEKEIIMHRDNIIKCIDYLELKDECIFVSELCDYDLENYVVSDMEDNESVSLCKEAIDVLLELLTKGTIFKDIKPLNFLIKVIDGQSRLKLADLDTVAFAPKILAPEIMEKFAQGKNIEMNDEYKEPQLIWELGLLMYYICFKEDPIDMLLRANGFDPEYDVTLPQLRSFLRNLTDYDIKKYLMPADHAQIPSSLNPFVDIIESMLTVDPAKRPSLKEIQTKWNAAMQALPQNDSEQDNLSKSEDNGTQSYPENNNAQRYHDQLTRVFGNGQKNQYKKNEYHLSLSSCSFGINE